MDLGPTERVSEPIEVTPAVHCPRRAEDLLQEQRPAKFFFCVLSVEQGERQVKWTLSSNICRLFSCWCTVDQSAA